MALQSSPPISMQDLCTEFQVSLPKSLYDFRRGGGIVPDTAANAGVPTGFPIDLYDFFGATRAAVNNPLQGGTAARVVLEPATATAQVIVRRNGTIDMVDGSDHNWWAAAPDTTIGDSYYVKLVKNSGDDTNQGGLALNTWYQLNTDRTFGQTRNTLGVRSGTFTLYIATAANDANIIASGSYTIMAQVDSNA